MNGSTPALKLALCLSAAAGLHLGLFALVAPQTDKPQIRGGPTRVVLGISSAELTASAPEALDTDKPAAKGEPDKQSARNEPEPQPGDMKEAKEQPASKPSPQEPLPQPAPQKPLNTEVAANAARPSEMPQTNEKPASTGGAPLAKKAAPEPQTAPPESGRAMPISTSAKDEDQSQTPSVETPGNAAADNYSGLVMKHISRIPRPRAPSPGSAFVSFTVTKSGDVEQISISKSSGSARFDREAMKLVRQAVPFPPPPAGIHRTFEMKIEGR